MFGRIFRFLVFIQRFWHSEIAEGMKNRKKKKYNTKLHEFRVAHGSCRFIHKLRVDCITIHALVLCFLHFCHRKGRQVYWERERERTAYYDCIRTEILPVLTWMYRVRPGMRYAWGTWPMDVGCCNRHILLPIYYFGKIFYNFYLYLPFGIRVKRKVFRVYFNARFFSAEHARHEQRHTT